MTATAAAAAIKVQWPTDSPAMTPATPTGTRMENAQQMPMAAPMPMKPTGVLRSATGHHRSQLAQGGGPSRAIRGLIHPAGQADPTAGIIFGLGEDVDPVHEDAGRAMETDPRCILGGADQLSRDRHVRQLSGDLSEMAVGHLPVRAVGEVEQRHVHHRTVDLDLRIKVKR